MYMNVRCLEIALSRFGKVKNRYKKYSMDNKIIKGLLSDFLIDFGIEESRESVQFEHFCNYCVFTLNCADVYNYDNLLYQEVHTGERGDFAIDGAMVVVNDVAITEAEQLEDVVGKRKFDAQIIFVQAKTSPSFDSGEMLKTGLGVKDIFASDSLDRANERIIKTKAIIDAVFEKSAQFKANPVCKVYYVTTGKWNDDPNLTRVVDECEQQLRSLNIFSQVDYLPIDASRIISIYKEIKNAISREIVISKIISFPPNINGVEQAYLGLIQIGEYLKLITDENGDIIQGLFYDNVRSYLGENPVNSEIKSTLENKEKYIQFPILNNGVTIVTKNLNPSGDKYLLTDYQIVNGCQTSHVLYYSRDVVGADMVVPVKIIHTEDPNLIADIIRSTNRQTQVLDEAFESLKAFHKSLQDYYNSIRENDRIYYERRSHEYDYKASDVQKSNIISLPIQLKAFICMFLGEPHSMHRYYGELLKANKGRVFQPDHQLCMYYASAWTLHRIEGAISRHDISSQYGKYRYHLLLMIQVYVRRLAKFDSLPDFSSKAMVKLCDAIMTAVSDDRSLGAVLRQLVPILTESEKLIKGGTYDLIRNGPAKRKEFTSAIVKAVGELPIQFS